MDGLSDFNRHSVGMQMHIKSEPEFCFQPPKGKHTQLINQVHKLATLMNSTGKCDYAEYMWLMSMDLKNAML
jgi:hypothetical protein